VGKLETVKVVSDVASNVVTIAAAIAAAIGTYWAFFRERTRWPKANLELIVSHLRLTDEQSLLHTKVKVHNAGRGLMKLTRIRTDVYQVRPLHPESLSKLDAGLLKPELQPRADWEGIGDNTQRWGEEPDEPEPEIEPGENDDFGCDFIVPSTLETVLVYVYIANEAKRHDKPLGWSVTSYYDLEGGAGTQSTVNVVAGEAATPKAKEEVA
jgi:hypothetical protein